MCLDLHCFLFCPHLFFYRSTPKKASKTQSSIVWAYLCPLSYFILIHICSPVIDLESWVSLYIISLIIIVIWLSKFSLAKQKIADSSVMYVVVSFMLILLIYSIWSPSKKHKSHAIVQSDFEMYILPLTACFLSNCSVIERFLICSPQKKICVSPPAPSSPAYKLLPPVSISVSCWHSPFCLQFWFFTEAPWMELLLMHWCLLHLIAQLQGLLHFFRFCFLLSADYCYLIYSAVLEGCPLFCCASFHWSYCPIL